MSEQQIIDSVARAIQAHDDNTGLLLDDSAGAVQAFYLELAEKVWATIRAGVESGTIEGEVVRVFRWWNGKARMDPHLENLKSGEYVVIGPVSDGGSET